MQRQGESLVVMAERRIDRVWWTGAGERMVPNWGINLERVDKRVDSLYPL